MAKRDNNKCSARASAGCPETYSETVIEQIIVATGRTIVATRRRELMNRLEQAAKKLFTQQEMSQQPTAKMLRDKFSKIEKAAKALRAEIGVGANGSIRAVPSFVLDPLHLAAIKKGRKLGMSGNSFLHDVVAGIVQIERWAKKQTHLEATREAQRRELSGVTNPRRGKKSAMKYWVLELSVIYHEFFDTDHIKPTFTWDEYKHAYSGGFFNFVRCAANALNDKSSDAALAEYIKKAAKLKGSKL